MERTNRRDFYIKISILAVAVLITVAIHYGWVLYHIFGHTEWAHAVHSRFCYIPIVIASVWFGLRGGIIAAAGISALVLPYLFFDFGGHPIEMSREVVEIFFYFGVGILVGGLIDRELRVRARHQETRLALERSQHLSLVGQMAAGVAHEIKNPLASIKGAVEIICSDGTNSDARKEFQQIASSEIKRIDGTVREFLAFGRPQPLKMEKLDLSTRLNSTLTQVEAQVKNAGLTLTRDIADNCRVNADGEKLHQVILNLVLNGIEASKPGGTIAVTLRPENAHLCLEIADSGSGIPKDRLDKIFEPFYTTKTSGNGLGLAIAKTIIEQHEGAITVDSVVGQGTAVRITLPALRESVWA